MTVGSANQNVTFALRATILASDAQLYAARVAAVSTPLSAPTIAAVETWVAALKTAGVWDSIKDCGLMLGSDLAGALVKVKYPTGVPSSLLNTGLTNANYQPVGGMGWFGGNQNDNQAIDTVATIAQLGVSGTNLTMGLMRMDYRDESRPWFSEALDTGTAESPAYIADFNSGTPDKVAVTGNGPSLRFFSQTADSKLLMVENAALVQGHTGTNGGTVTDLLNGHFTLFKARRFGFDFFGTLRAGFYCLGTAMTRQQLVALSLATRNLYKTVGRIVTLPEEAYIGDSITAGFFVSDPNNRWSTKSAVARARWETNFGVPSSSIRVVNADAAPLIDRYQEIIATAPDSYSFMMGTNDLLQDGTTNGDPTIIADCKAKMTTVMTAAKATGKPVRWNGFPFTPNATLAKASAYETAFADVARQVGASYCSQWLRMADTGNPASLLGGDGVHPNEAGMTFLSNGDVELATGKTSRTLTLSFPSIAAGGGTQDQFVTLYPAALQSGYLNTTVTPPAGLTGITASATVTAANTVRVRLTNTSGAPSAPINGVFTVTLTF